MPEVKEVFGKFAVEIDGDVKLFDDKGVAEAEVVMATNLEDMTARATAYCEARGLEGKNAVGKTRIIIDFLAFEIANGIPEPKDPEDF